MSFSAQTSPVNAEQLALKVTVWRRATILLTLLGLMVLLNVTQFAWISSILFLAAIFTVAMTMVRIAALKPSPVVYLMYSMVILMCALLAFSSLITAIFSGISSDYARCTQQATTLARADLCTTTMENDLLDTLVGK